MSKSSVSRFQMSVANVMTVTLCALHSSCLAQAWTEGVGTHFQAIGAPYGACGVPETVLQTEDALDYVALNVFDAPGNYSPPGDFGPRPLAGADTADMGAYANGHNCGRWIEITLGDDCSVANGGEAGKPVCGGGSGWKSDSLNGATLKAIVTDQCSDNNAWCRDVPGHLDIHTPSLNHFRMPGGALIPPYATLTGNAWVTTGYNNRKVRWRFSTPPTQQGDIHIHYTQGSGPWWRRILITNLPNGIHGVEQYLGNGQWAPARMDADMGQQWILPHPELPEPMRIRVRDADDSLIFGGRTYVFSLPASCDSQCTEPAVQVTYAAEGGRDPLTALLSPNRDTSYGPQPAQFNLLGQRQSSHPLLHLIRLED